MKKDRVDVNFEFEEKYELGSEIGRGGMGVVYRGIERATGRNLAIKFFKLDLFDSSGSRLKFEQEARILARLARPGCENLIKVYGFGKVLHHLYIAFEFVEGSSLRELMKNGSTFTLDRVLEMISQICFGLGALHQNQVVHMDLKPGNIMIADDGTAKLIDLGVALTLNQRKHNAGDGIIQGTPYYMSPEQCRDENITYASDLYSLGVVFYELIVGMPPFIGCSPLEIIDKHLHQAPVPPIERGVDIPDRINKLVMKLLEKDPSLRVKSALALKKKVDRVRRGGVSDIRVGAAERLGKSRSKTRPVKQ